MRGTCGFTVLRYWAFFDAVFRYLILTCGIAVSSSLVVCDLIILADGIRGNMIVRGSAVRLFALSFRYNTQNKTQ